MTTKICPKCHESKLLTEFYKNASNSDGLQHVCKICSSLSNKLSFRKKRVDYIKSMKAKGYHLVQYLDFDSHKKFLPRLLTIPRTFVTEEGKFYSSQMKSGRPPKELLAGKSSNNSSIICGGIGGRNIKCHWLVAFNFWKVGNCQKL